MNDNSEVANSIIIVGDSQIHHRFFEISLFEVFHALFTVWGRYSIQSNSLKRLSIRNVLCLFLQLGYVETQLSKQRRWFHFVWTFSPSILLWWPFFLGVTLEKPLLSSFLNFRRGLSDRKVSSWTLVIDFLKREAF